MTISFKNQTVTVIRPVNYIEERGDRFPDWSTAEEHELRGCRVQPMASDEVLFSGSVTNEGGTARDGIVTRWKLFTSANPNLTPHDRIRYDGVVYEIDGQVLDWPSPTSALAHSEVVLKRVDG